MFLIIRRAGGWMAFAQEVGAGMDCTNTGLIALFSLLFGDQQTLVLKSFACTFR